MNTQIDQNIQNVTPSAVSTNDIPNKSTQNDVLIMSRLILQKIMSSDSVRFISEESYKTLQAAFLSEQPTKDLVLQYELSSIKSYYKRVSVVTIKWTDDKKEILDDSGNVWVTKRLETLASIESDYTSSYSTFCQRAECVGLVRTMLLEIHDMIPHGLNIQILNNDQRIDRDEKRKYDAACADISAIIKHEKSDYRRNLRRGGRQRIFRKEGSFTRISNGKYAVHVDDGSRYRKKIKTYSVIVNDTNVTIRRVS